MTGYLYPNEVEVQWSLLIVLYPYITGLVAGAFIVSAFYHVFGMDKLKPVARMSLLTALSFLLVAPLPLLLHLGRPERGIEIFLTPQPRSAMAGFGYIWAIYFVILLFEVWLVFRNDIVAYARSSPGLKGALYRALALGVLDLSPESLNLDKRLVKMLSAIGIPAAVLLHGYVGFIFGAVKANPWWSTPLMPLIFLLSAIVSGIALLIFLYVIVSWARRQPLDHACIRSLASWLLAFILLDIALEGLEMLSMFYESEESWEIISRLINRRLRVSLFLVQIGLGALLPAALLLTLLSVKPGSRALAALGLGGAALVLLGIFAMRWNVVIGGQMFSKSLLGLSSYTPPLFGREGVLISLAVLALPFLIFSVLSYLVPPWREEKQAQATTPGRTWQRWT